MESPKKKGSKKARLSMARLAAVQCVYQWLQANTPAKDVLAYYDDHFTGLKVEEEEILPPDRELLSDLLIGVQTEHDVLQEIVKAHFQQSDSSEGKEAKKDLIILSVLYCGTYELLKHLQYDPALIISEYLHIAYSFYDQSEIKFINGVLDSIKSTVER